METGPVPVEETEDPTLEKGKQVVDEFGSPPRRDERCAGSSTTPNGKLLYDNTWRSYYVGEPSLVRVGTKEPPKKPAAKPAVKPEKPGKGGRRDDDAGGGLRGDGAAGGYDSCSAVAIASTNHGGTRVGCERRGVDRRVPRLGRCHQLSLALDPVLVSEACPADVDAPQVDRQHVVERGGGAVVDPHPGRQRLEPLRLDRPVAARVVGQVRDPRHLEPHDVRGVMRDALRIGLRETDADVVGASESLRHRATIRSGASAAACLGGMTGVCHKRRRPQRMTGT